jgi:hypothetical protein
LIGAAEIGEVVALLDVLLQRLKALVSDVHLTLERLVELFQLVSQVLIDDYDVLSKLFKFAAKALFDLGQVILKLNLQVL